MLTNFFFFSYKLKMQCHVIGTGKHMTGLKVWNPRIRYVLRKWLPTFTCLCVSLMERQWNITTATRVCKNVRFVRSYTYPCVYIYVYIYTYDRILNTYACTYRTHVCELSVTCTHVYALSGAPSGYPWLARANHHNGYDHLHSFL